MQTRNENSIAQATNGMVKSAVGFIDSLNLGVIFGFHLQPLLLQFLMELGKYIFFPIAAAAAVFSAILTWRQAALDDWKGSSVANAVIETIVALGITVAVIGTLVASTVFALATPIIFTTVIAGKTLYHAGMAIGHRIKYAFTQDEADLQTAKSHVAPIVPGIIATGGVVGLFLLGQKVLAIVGIVAAVIGTALSIFFGYKNYQAAQASKAAQPVITEDGLEKDDNQPKPSVEPSNKKILGNELTSTQPVVIKRTQQKEELAAPLLTAKSPTTTTKHYTNDKHSPTVFAHSPRREQVIQAEKVAPKPVAGWVR